jgi:circadian clock protein KaiB
MKPRSTKPPAPAAEVAPAKFVFRLYVGGTTPASTRAVVNTRRMCERFSEEEYQLEILDIRDHLVLAKQDQVVAIPTLVRLLPAPPRRFIGDLSDERPVLQSLGRATPPSPAAVGA